MRRKTDKAEEAAFAYQRELGMNDSVSDEHIVARRMGFYDGYRQAEKETIEKAVAWLKKNVNNYIANCTESYPDAPFKATVGGTCWEHLKKAMEEK